MRVKCYCYRGSKKKARRRTHCQPHDARNVNKPANPDTPRKMQYGDIWRLHEWKLPSCGLQRPLQPWPLCGSLPGLSRGVLWVLVRAERTPGAWALATCDSKSRPCRPCRRSRCRHRMAAQARPGNRPRCFVAASRGVAARRSGEHVNF